MARALKNPDIDPVYLDFFGMTRPPFAPLSAPSQMFHSEQYSLLMAHLASVTKQADCLMIVCGADGSGKTTLLNRYITSLSDETSFATFDETCADGTEFYCAILRQLGFHDITGTLRELRRITKEFLIHRGMARDPVLLIMDNAHLVSPTVLEQLRWISETKVEDRRVLSVVLAGTADLPRIMDSPAMKLMKFRSHVEFTVRVFTEQETEDYVRHRLRLAGGVDAAKFSNDAHPLIYRFSGGIPDVINKLCNEVLAEARTRETRVISGELIRTVADKNRFKPNVVQLKGKGRRKTDAEYRLDVPDQKDEERITSREAPVKTSSEASGSDAAAAAADVLVLKEHIARMQAQLVALKAENQQAQLDIGAYGRDIAGLHEQLAAKTKENEELCSDVGKMDELQKQLKAKTHQVEVLGKAGAEIDALRDDLDARTRETEDLGKTIGEIDDLQKQLDKKTEENKALVKAAAQGEDLQKKLNAKTKEAEKLGKAAAEVDDLRDQLHAKTAENATLSETAAEVVDLKKQLTARTKDSKKLSSNASELAELRKQLEAKTRQAQKLSGTIEKNTEKIEELEVSLSDSTVSLKDSEKTSKALTRDLKKEQNATRRAVASAEKRVEKLNVVKADLQQSVRKLTADLKRANKNTKDDEPLEKEIRSLEKKLTEKSELLEFGDELVTKLETSLQESRDECDALRAGEDALLELRATFAEKDDRISFLETELASYSHLITTTQPTLSDEDVDAKSADNSADTGASSAVAPVESTISSIEIIKDKQVEKVVTIAEMPARIMIGRGEDCELFLNSKFVSRHHALIFCEGGEMYIEDLNSFNGTVVNYKKVLRCELHPDDRIVVGDYEMRLL